MWMLYRELYDYICIVVICIYAIMLESLFADLPFYEIISKSAKNSIMKNNILTLIDLHGNKERNFKIYCYSLGSLV
jgi:predicted MPP superfamily phosphohydrolase